MMTETSLREDERTGFFEELQFYEVRSFREVGYVVTTDIPNPDGTPQHLKSPATVGWVNLGQPVDSPKTHFLFVNPDRIHVEIVIINPRIRTEDDVCKDMVNNGIQPITIYISGLVVGIKEKLKSSPEPQTFSAG